MIFEKISNKYKLTQAGEFRLLPFDEKILEEIFTDSPELGFFEFLEESKIRSNAKDVPILWGKWYKMLDAHGFTKKTPIFRLSEDKKHKYLVPKNLKQYDEIPKLTPLQQQIADKYKLTKKGILKILSFNDNALIFAISRYEKEYKNRQYFYLTYFCWFAEDFCKKNHMKFNKEKFHVLSQKLEIQQTDPFSELSDPAETQILSPEEFSQASSKLNDRLSKRLPIDTFVIGQSDKEYTSDQISILKEQNKEKQLSRNKEYQKYKDIFTQEDTFDYGDKIAPESKDFVSNDDDPYNQSNLPF